MELRELLIYLTEELGISVTLLAQKSGVNKATIYKFIEGSRSMNAANQAKVAASLQQSLAKLRK